MLVEPLYKKDKQTNKTYLIGLAGTINLTCDAWRRTKRVVSRTRSDSRTSVPSHCPRWLREWKPFTSMFPYCVRIIMRVRYHVHRTYMYSREGGGCGGGGGLSPLLLNISFTNIYIIVEK